MTWDETTEELIAIKAKFNPYHEIQANAKKLKIDLTPTQELELKALRARAVELSYVRIGLLIAEQRKNRLIQSAS